MSSRLNPPEQTHKNRQLLALRKKYEPIEPIVPNSGHESPLLNTLALQPHHELPQHPKDHNLDPDQDFYLPQTNKIYHNSGTTRHLQIYRGSNQLKAPRASLNNLCKLEI